MDNLNNFETSILEIILEENKEKYFFLKSHLPFLKVKSREYTGVGLFTNFEDLSIDKQAINVLLSSSNALIIDNLKNELTYELAVTDGRIDFLELVTNGNESWDGSFKKFHFLKTLN